MGLKNGTDVIPKESQSSEPKIQGPVSQASTQILEEDCLEKPSLEGGRAEEGKQRREVTRQLEWAP